jgi:hypothetical protein
MIIVIFFVNDDNIFAGIPFSASKDDDDYKDAERSTLAALSLSIIVIAFEFAVLMFGVTMQAALVSIVSISFHALGVVFLIWFFLLSWRFQVLWSIWVLTNLVPFTTEVICLITFKIFANTKN